MVDCRAKWIRIRLYIDLSKFARLLPNFALSYTTTSPIEIPNFKQIIYLIFFNKRCAWNNFSPFICEFHRPNEDVVCLFFRSIKWSNVKRIFAWQSVTPHIVLTARNGATDAREKQIDPRKWIHNSDSSLSCQNMSWERNTDLLKFFIWKSQELDPNVVEIEEFLLLMKFFYEKCVCLEMVKYLFLVEL